MRIFLASDVRVGMHENRYYARNQVSSILERYYQNFGKMILCCRVQPVADISKDYYDISDWVEEIIPANSLGKMLMGGYKKEMISAIEKCDMVICRCPAFSAYRAADYARKCRKPCYAENMGCAWDAFWNHSLIGKLIAPYMYLKMRSVVKQADYALYVTNSFLQERYPCNGIYVGISDVLIDDVSESVLTNRRKRIAASDKKVLTLMTTAAIDVRYKGQEYVIRAIPLLNDAGIRVHYKMAGGGNADYLKGIAEKLGVSEQVEFLGRLSREQVIQNLDDCDIYVQPSLQEGLPRAVVEAMSRGCPVLGAKTGGIPELIAPECVFKRKSAEAIADKILSVWDKDKLVSLAEQNFETAGEYLDEVLAERRNRYFDWMRLEIEGK